MGAQQGRGRGCGQSWPHFLITRKAAEPRSFGFEGASCAKKRKDEKQKEKHEKNNRKKTQLNLLKGLRQAAWPKSRPELQQQVEEEQQQQLKLETVQRLKL